MSLLPAGDSALSARRALGVLVLAAGVGGCAVGKQLFSGRGDYRLYRETKTAPTLEARLLAADRYLKESPDGDYAPEIRAWFSPTEAKYVARAHDSLPLLRAYLKALPDGPRAPEVRARARQLEDAVKSASDRELNRDARLATLQADLARAAEQRKAFLGDLRSLVATLSTVRVWDQPVSAIDPELAARLNLADPATCQLDVCAKPFTARFAIPQKQGRLVPRDASFEVEIALKAGLVTEIRLAGRELFSRVGEAQDLNTISFADPQARAEAIGRALTLLGGALGSAFPEESCARPAVSPIVLDRACNGSRVTVTAAVDSGGADGIVWSSDAPPASAVKKSSKGAGKSTAVPARANPPAPAGSTSPAPSVPPPKAPVPPASGAP
jgi:hypothetical protein